MMIFFSIDMKLQIEHLPRVSESPRLFKMDAVKPKHWAFSAHACFRSLCTRTIMLYYEQNCKKIVRSYSFLCKTLKHIFVCRTNRKPEKYFCSAEKCDILEIFKQNKAETQYVYLCRYLLFVVHNIILLQIIPKFGRNIEKLSKCQPMQ